MFYGILFPFKLLFCNPPCIIWNDWNKWSYCSKYCWLQTKVIQKRTIHLRRHSTTRRKFSSKLQTPLTTSFSSKRVPYPKEITSYLDQFVVGQEYAKKILAVGVYQHYKRFSYNAILKEKGSQAFQFFYRDKDCCNLWT